MLKGAFVVCVVAAALVGSLPTESRAAVAKATSTIYFDSHNNIIGQKILYCNGVHQHSGITDSTNKNMIYEEFGCGSQLVACGSSNVNGSPTFSCFPSGVDYGHQIVYFHSATGLTKTQYCNSPAGFSPFLGHPDCTLPAPAQVPQLSPFQNGW